MNTISNLVNTKQTPYFIQFKNWVKHLPFIGFIATAIWNQFKQLYKKINHFYTANALITLMKRIEYYQPLYRFPLEQHKQPQRICIDRADTIYQAIAAWGKGGRILDIGCSLGYFSYYFAERDYLVEGIDFDPKNIRICKLLQNLNTPKINFSTAEFSDRFLKEINNNQFDMVFLFSVMHHITHAQGLAYAQKLMADLSEKVPVLFVELAIKAEQTTASWRHNLPEDELAIFAQCADITIEKIGLFSNHLSSVLRPLYMVKKNTMQFCGKTYSVLARKFIPYHGFYDAGCRYYDCGDQFIKKCLPNINPKLNQLIKEIEHYQRLPKNDFFPTLLAFTVEKNNVGMVLSKLPGKNLYDQLVKGETKVILPIFIGIVNALRFLLQCGLYHNDVRLWNVMVDDKKTCLFDLGLADKEEKENTNLALQWVIAQLHQLRCDTISYPLTTPPDFSNLFLQSDFLPIIKALQDTNNFNTFLKKIPHTTQP